MALLQNFSTLALVGSSQSGKSTALRHLLLKDADLFESPISKLILVFKVIDREIDRLKRDLPDRIDRVFTSELPTADDLLTEAAQQSHLCLVYEDVCQGFTTNPYYANLITLLSSHAGITVIFLNQELTGKGIYASTICKNLHGVILMSCPKQRGNLLSLSKQVGRFQLLKQIYDAATAEKPYGYLLCNFHPRAHKKLRYLSGFLRGEEEGGIKAFVPKEGA